MYSRYDTIPEEKIDDALPGMYRLPSTLRVVVLDLYRRQFDLHPLPVECGGQDPTIKQNSPYCDMRQFEHNFQKGHSLM